MNALRSASVLLLIGAVFPWWIAGCSGPPEVSSSPELKSAPPPPPPHVPPDPEPPAEAVSPPKPPSAPSAPGARPKGDNQHDNSSHLAAVENRIKANYVFSCPKEIAVGQAEAAELVVSPSLSVSDLSKLVEEESIRFTGSAKLTPYVEAKIDYPHRDGLIVKAVTPVRQKLLPDDQNRWAWQLLGERSGEYLLSVSLSLCADASKSPPLATPVAFNRKIAVKVNYAGDGSFRISGHAVGTLVAVGAALLCGILGMMMYLHGKKITSRLVPVHPAKSGEHVFVSYSRYDSNLVDPVIRELEEAGHKVWIDREGIAGAASWRAEIVNALTSARYLLFFASKSSYESVNVGKELSLAADEGLAVVPILLEDCEPTGASKFVVSGVQRIEGRKRTAQQIAADISKVIAGETNND